MTMAEKLNKLDIYQLTEVLIATKYNMGLHTELEARQNIEAGKYTKEEILDSIAYKRTDGMPTHKERMNYLPISLRGVEEDYMAIL